MPFVANCSNLINIESFSAERSGIFFKLIDQFQAFLIFLSKTTGVADFGNSHIIKNVQL